MGLGNQPALVTRTGWRGCPAGTGEESPPGSCGAVPLTQGGDQEHSGVLMALVLRPHAGSSGGRGDQGSEAVSPECSAHLVWLCPQRRTVGREGPEQRLLIAGLLLQWGCQHDPPGV